MIPNSIETFPKTGSIRITSITNPAASTLVGILTAGRKICGINSTSTAVITGVGASVLSGSISDGGSNYVVDGSVDTFAITGGGSGLTLSITGVDSDTGAINAISAPISVGVGYKVGDIVGVVTSSVGTSGGQGRGAQITVASIVGINNVNPCALFAKPFAAVPKITAMSKIKYALKFSIIILYAFLLN